MPLIGVYVRQFYRLSAVKFNGRWAKKCIRVSLLRQSLKSLNRMGGNEHFIIVSRVFAAIAISRLTNTVLKTRESPTEPKHCQSICNATSSESLID
jgi:hypothetical protein